MAPQKKNERHCPACGTAESKTPGGKARAAVQAAQGARQQAQMQREMEMRRRAMLQPPAPTMPQRPQMPMGQPMPMQRPPMAPPAAAGMPGRPDPRQALLQAIARMRGGR